ncbi:hypothetical protein CEK26_010631 [Fusarium fujikuroi]|nr:hypothetical protein CEK27_010645 [Fusarium fujikuroi]QGI97562.1 hypothetical protein CEK26_010631 [Fusarium fujikuroi]SCV48323.1 uncharacterized protein FFFS_08520 [Fusarium fujikuroi]VZH97534.1 unnamed protein product [Fusarium fujikuroi]
MTPNKNDKDTPMEQSELPNTSENAQDRPLSDNAVSEPNTTVALRPAFGAANPTNSPGQNTSLMHGSTFHGAMGFSRGRRGRGRGRGQSSRGRGGIQKHKSTSLTQNIVMNKALDNHVNNTIAAPSSQTRDGSLSTVSTPRQAYTHNMGTEYDHSNEVAMRRRLVRMGRTPEISQVNKNECAFCERKTHKIDNHLDLPNGDLPGCILCHSIQHNTEDCAKLSDMSLTQKVRIFVDGRANLPPLRTRVPWWDLLYSWLQDDSSRGQQFPVGFPWSKEFTKEFTKEMSRRNHGLHIRDLQIQLDHRGYLPADFPKDETTATLDAVYVNHVAKDGTTWVADLAKRVLGKGGHNGSS